LSRDLARDEFIRKRVARQKMLRKRRLKILFVFLMLLLLLVGVILSLTVFFPIKNITASGSKVYKTEQIINASGIRKGDNLFVITNSGVLKNLKLKMPYIETVKLERKLTGDIKILVTDADEYATIFSKNKYFTVSKSGWVLSESQEPNENILEIKGAQTECKVGTQIVYKDEEQKELINRISEVLNTEKLKTDFIDISDSLNLQVGVEGRFTVLLGSSNNIEEKIKHLRGMVEKISPEKQGKINLSMWTIDNTSATFVEKNVE